MRKISFLFFVTFSSVVFSVESTNVDVKSSSSLELANVLKESGDICSSYTLYTQFIKEKESKKNLDKDYVDALHGALSIELTHGLNYQETWQKIQIHDQEHLPKIGFENGYMIMTNLPKEMAGEENKIWIKEIFAIFGMKVQDSDIIFQDNSIKIKFAPCCCCKAAGQTPAQ